MGYGSTTKIILLLTNNYLENAKTTSIVCKIVYICNITLLISFPNAILKSCQLELNFKFS